MCIRDSHLRKDENKFLEFFRLSTAHSIWPTSTARAAQRNNRSRLRLQLVLERSGLRLTLETLAPLATDAWRKTEPVSYTHLDVYKRQS